MAPWGLWDAAEMPRQWLLPMIKSNAVTLWREDVSRADQVLTKCRGVERRARTSRRLRMRNAEVRGYSLVPFCREKAHAVK
ncbi:hypothetical protein CFAM422_003614 [Trichoderma lentiforme]|uniref:Uncharacterized protein n=1 Tax=Trichoderma lentiforme TaxID=1567552 RepID=A0A9P4XL31_9HYPO|nr:hypothetical protein CFAM422_003614 [Trichoderma lentiforme]